MNKELLAAKNILIKPSYLITFLLTAFLFVLFAIWLPNLTLIRNTIFANHLELHYKIKFLKASLGAFNTNFTFLSRTLTICVSIAFGLSISFTTYYLKNRITSLRADGSLSILGLIVGVFGVGCAACGSVILTQLLGISSLLFINILPLKGLEFSIISLIILSYSIHLTLSKIANPQMCKLKYS